MESECQRKIKVSRNEGKFSTRRENLRQTRKCHGPFPIAWGGYVDTAAGLEMTLYQVFILMHKLEEVQQEISAWEDFAGGKGRYASGWVRQITQGHISWGRTKCQRARPPDVMWMELQMKSSVHEPSGVTGENRKKHIVHGTTRRASPIEQNGMPNLSGKMRVQNLKSDVPKTL